MRHGEQSGVLDNFLFEVTAVCCVLVSTSIERAAGIRYTDLSIFMPSLSSKNYLHIPYIDV